MIWGRCPCWWSKSLLDGTPCFSPRVGRKSSAEMTKEEKNSLSIDIKRWKCYDVGLRVKIDFLENKSRTVIGTTVASILMKLVGQEVGENTREFVRNRTSELT
jgi:hypothetical protein